LPLKFLKIFNLKGKKQFSIITPIFNRSQYLPEIFNSLSQQHEVDFEWIIVDDGSSDTTKEIVSSFEKIFSIKYIKHENKGKPAAINSGLEQANSHITLILNSDETLCENILKDIWNYYDSDNGTFRKNTVCIAGLTKHINGGIIGKKVFIDLLVSDHIRYIKNRNIAGDKCLFYATEILKKYPYPIIENEKNITPNLIHSRIALMHKTLYTNQIFLEKQASQHTLVERNYWSANPLGSELYFNEASIPPYRLKLQIKHSSEYIFYAKMNRRKNIYANAKNKKIYPIGLIYYFMSRIKSGNRKFFW